MIPRNLVVLVLLGGLWLRTAGAANVPAAPDKFGELLANSPFGLSKAGAAGGSTAGDPLEFRAVVAEEGGNRLFSLYDTSTHRSIWVELNDPVNGFAVKGYDETKDTVTVDYRDKVLTLAIKRAPVVAQAVAAAPVPGLGPVPVNGSPGNPPGVTGPVTVDQQRIQQIQEEIRRRRALRQQAASPGNSPNGLPGNDGVPRPMPSNMPGPQLIPSTSPGPQPIPANN